MPIQVYVSISTCDQDQRLWSAIEVHAAPLTRKGALSFTRPLPGDDVQRAAAAALQAAQAALILLSPDSLASESCLAELRCARQQPGLLVLPVLLRPCSWQEVPDLASLSPLPLSSQQTPLAISLWPHQDEALDALLRQLRARLLPPRRPVLLIPALLAAALLAAALLQPPAPSPAPRPDPPPAPRTDPGPRPDLAPPSPDLRRPARPRAAPPQQGAATCNGGTCTLEAAAGSLRGHERVCLFPGNEDALRGGRPTCTLLPGNGPPTCTRTDALYRIPLSPPVVWRVPCQP